MSRSNVTTSLDVDRAQWADKQDRNQIRPQTARAALGGPLRGASSPYNAPPGDPQIFGLRPRSSHQPAPTTQPSDRQNNGRALYIKVPRPPEKEYRPLRDKSGFGRTGLRSAGSNREEIIGTADGESRPLADNDNDSFNRRPFSAKARMQGIGPRGNTGGVPQMHEFASMHVRQDAFAGGLSVCEEQGKGEVAIFPSAGSMHFVPPQPVRQDPTPRRRMTLTAHPEAPQSHAGQKAEPQMPKKSALIKELGPAMTAIASLTHETNIGKLVRSIEAVTLVLLEADVCRIYLYDAKHRLLQVLRPGETLEGGTKDNQMQARGVVGLVAGSGSMEKVFPLHHHAAFDQKVDTGHGGPGRIPKMAYLCAPSRNKNKSNDVVAVVSALRIGAQAKPFSEDDESLMELIASQVGVALSHALQRNEMVRSKWQHKVLVKAAIQLTANLDLEQGALCCLASTFAKKLTDADFATVCLTYDQNRMMRTYDLVDPPSPSKPNLPRAQRTERLSSVESTEGQTSPPRREEGVRMQEHKDMNVPSVLKKVVTTSSVCNVLVQNAAQPETPDSDAPKEHLPAGWPGDGKVVTSVFAGEATGNDTDVDSCLAVPLHTHAGAKVFGIIQVMNRCGGPRKVGKHGVFSKNDEDVLRELAFIVASALQRFERIEGLEGALRDASEITSLDKEHAVVEHLRTQAMTSIRADLAFVFLLDPDGNWQLFEPEPEEIRRRSMRRPLQEEKKQAVLRLPANCYPLNAAEKAWTTHMVKLRDVSEKILARKGGLMTHATTMMACAIRDVDGAVYGVLLLANQMEDHFPRHGKRMVNEMCVQAGTVLKKCHQFKEHEDNAKNLQHASIEMLDVIKNREIEQIIKHVSSTISGFMSCSRAVLYIVDVGNHTLWTIGPDENLIMTSIKENADPTVEGSRSGFANIALNKKEAIAVKDFAYGQHAFNDILDSADIQHVVKLIKLQGMAGTSEQDDVFKLMSELEPEERTESTAVIPICNPKREVVAVLQVMNKWKSNRAHRLRKEGFDIYDMDKLALIGEAIAVSLENAAVMNRRWEAESNLRALCDSVLNGLSVGLGTASIIDIDDALSYAAKKTAEMCGATQVALYLLDKFGQMDFIRFEGSHFRPSQRVKRPISGVTGQVVTTGKLVNVEDARDDPNFDPEVDQKEHLPVVSCICCPVLNPTGRILGCLMVQNKRGEDITAGENTDPFTSLGTHSSRKAGEMRGTDHGWAEFSQCDEKVVEAASQGIGTALTQSELFGHVTNVAEKLHDMTGELQQHGMLMRVANACETVCHARRCMVFLLDDKNFKMVHAGSEDGHGEVHISADYGLPGAVRRSGGTIVCNSQDEIFEAMRGQDDEPSATNTHKETYDEFIEETENAIAVPIMNERGRVVGVLEVANKVGTGGFEPADERVLKMLAAHASTMIKHCRMFEYQNSKRSGLEEMLHSVVALVQKVACSYPQQVSEAAAYRDIVRATCLMLGARRGHLYVLVPGDERHWAAYDEEGNVVSERTSRVAMSVLETGSLQNHTRTRLHRPKFKDVPKEGEEDEEEEEESSSDEDDEREPNDSKLMCAPILKPNDVTMGVHGHTVLGALEVEAAVFSHEWRSEQEELLQTMAGVTASLIDIMLHLQHQTPAAFALSRRNSEQSDAVSVHSQPGLHAGQLSTLQPVPSGGSAPGFDNHPHHHHHNLVSTRSN